METATFNASAKIDHDSARLSGALNWLACIASTNCTSQVTSDMIRNALIEEHGPVDTITYGILAGTNGRAFIAALKTASGVKLPNSLDKVFEAFFKSWHGALQCDTCGMLAVQPNDDRQGATLISGPSGCRFNCSGTFCDSKIKTEIVAWPDGTRRPITDTSYFYLDSQYPLHHKDLAQAIKDKEFVLEVEAAGVEIQHFFRYCLVTGTLAEACNFNPTPRGLWEFFFDAKPMARYYKPIKSAIQAAKDWKEGEKVEKPRGEKTEVKELLPQAMLQDIGAAFSSVGLDRNAVLCSIDRSIASAIPSAPSPGQQVGVDVSYLNNRELPIHPMNGHPFASWLSNAAHLARPRREAAVFARALESLKIALANR